MRRPASASASVSVRRPWQEEASGAHARPASALARRGHGCDDTNERTFVAGWGGGGGGYAREGRTGAILIRNRKTNATSAAVQTVHLDPAAATGAGRTLRLSGWASAAGLKSKGTCADEGSCTLSDTFGLAATLVRPS